MKEIFELRLKFQTCNWEQYKLNLNIPSKGKVTLKLTTLNLKP